MRSTFQAPPVPLKCAQLTVGELSGDQSARKIPYGYARRREGREVPRQRLTKWDYQGAVQPRPTSRPHAKNPRTVLVSRQI
jgi:hypothetical protein